MKKAPLYSRSHPPMRGADEPARGEAAQRAGTGGTAIVPAAAQPAGVATRRARLKAWLARHERRLWAGAVVVLVAAVALRGSLAPRPPPLTLAQIDTAMRKSIDEKPLPSAAARAYETILPSVVRVVGLMTEGDDGRDDGRTRRGPVERGVGTGVVIIDNGTILTNLHVVKGARRIQVLFMDGTESDAQLLSTRPQDDLAVLRANTIPDDLEAATLRSTADLAPGDQVLAVGFPFGIGPSASAGVVSGLKREFRSPEGRQTLTNLIQFDAAANPGNSGGPLVTMDGEVVGIVTAILNPSRERTFIGIGFAMPIENAAAAVGMPPF
jgi:S1-C subfamily serine protease